MRQGDVASFVNLRKVIHGYIWQWNGDPDRRPRMIDLSLHSYDGEYESSLVEPGQPSIFGYLFLNEDEGRSLKEKFEALLASPEGKQKLKALRRRAPAQTEDMPRPNRGITYTYHEPLRPSVYGSSEWSRDMRYYISDYRVWMRMFEDLKARYPRLYEVVWAGEDSGATYDEIAESLGIKKTAVAMRHSRGMAWMRERYARAVESGEIGS